VRTSYSGWFDISGAGSLGFRPRPVPQLGYPSFDQPGLAVGGVVPPDPISESIDAAERHVERS
jgi:hypothetical protein